ncbi:MULTISPECIES: ATP-binding protein [unclassified Synechococcus]|uniref:ATP-binding protein n=1 Tax=unclassified Synechococcus TaxID=2626047 RepID=UPI0021A3AB87|nr:MULTISPECIES: ATP-binding protein [unclassified Synechococcus]MCT0212442.1 WYL domain-containing protein [Synechococcus sp. CS-1326]
MSVPLSCHLLIGPPASGKTTLANELAPLLTPAGDPPAVVLSTDRIRADVFGDAAVQGPWLEIRERLLEQLRQEVAAGRPVILDATHARRPWRLAYTQALELPAPVEWIGWWLHTSESQCLAWNKTRQRQVPEPVIREMAAAISHKTFGPSRAEGFAVLVGIDPSRDEVDASFLQAQLDQLDTRIRNAANKEQGKTLHAYSRLLDLERLLYLMRLLSSFPELDAKDEATREQLEAIVSPLPEGSLAERAAIYLRSWNEIQGGFGECYASPEAIERDLHWLEANGFLCSKQASRAAIEPGPFHSRPVDPVHGGYPAHGDLPIFQRVFTLLRHILQEPFDAHTEGEPPAKKSSGPSTQKLPSHLIRQLAEIPGSYMPGEQDTLQQDVRHLLTPYGFRKQNDNARHGYAIGNAVLSGPQLLEVYGWLRETGERLADPSHLQLLEDLRRRLSWGGLLVEGDQKLPLRAVVNRSIVHPRAGSLAADTSGSRIDTAIVEHRRVQLSRDKHASSHPNSPDGVLTLWPLQVLFHNIAWYLAYEEWHPGKEHGLIRTERLDRLHWIRADGAFRRDEEIHHQALDRLGLLLQVCGGIYFGEDVEAQLDLASTTPARQKRQLTNTLRFSCQEWSFAFIREASKKFPTKQVRYSKPLIGHAGWKADKLHCLQPNPLGDTHPFPVEIDLPIWTIEQDRDLQAWLFRLGPGIRIEKPDSLRALHRTLAQEVVAIYEESM